MTLRLRRPSEDDLRDLLERARGARFTYATVGMAHHGHAPPRYRVDRWERHLGTGGRVFERAAAALRGWEMHRRSGLVVLADGPAEVGTVVAMSAPVLVGHVDITCRVVEVIDRPDRHGFAYGTLPEHPEEGEEVFLVARSADGAVTLSITTASRIRHPLGRLLPPVARLVQHRATTRYLDAMEALVRA